MEGQLMRMTSHAKVRAQQRAISEGLIDLILRYGTPERKPGDAIIYTIQQKESAKTSIKTDRNRRG
jgi:hypothetical protein